MNNIDPSLSEKIEQLSPSKRALLEMKLKQQQPQFTEITPLPRTKPLPLSFGQQRFWFMEELNGENSHYNIFQAFKFTGNLNQTALQKAFQTLVNRHETLRTSFQTLEGSPVQVISPQLEINLPVINLQGMSEPDQEVKVQGLAIAESQKPFNLSQLPLIRVTLIQLQDQIHLLFLTVHHIISDGWSGELLIKEISLLYQAYLENKPNPLPDLPIQYVDFASWQRQWLTGAKLESHLSYWRSHLENSPTLLNLPTDRERPMETSYQGNSQTFVINSFLTQELKRLSNKSKVTLFVTLLSAFAILLNRYSFEEDLIIGTPIANRTRPEIESLIGFFVNTLALRIKINNQPIFSELLHQVRQIAFEAYRHQDLPFEKLIEELQPERSLNYHPLFQVMFVLQNQAVSEWNLPNLTRSQVKFPSQTSQFDLTLSLKEKKGQLEGVWVYNTDLFDADRIERMTGHFKTLLEGIVNNPEAKITHLPILTSEEKQKMLIDWNNTKADYPKDKCIHQLFEEQVIKTPHNIALVCEDKQLSYQELNEKANQLAHYLQKLGVKPEVLVGICVERKLDLVVGLLAILKAGGAYVPIDPAYPTERFNYILNDTQIAILLTQEHLLEKISQGITDIVCLDRDQDLILREKQTNSVVKVRPENLAYVIYTSGSTGQPKGVAVEHKSVVNFLHFRNSQMFTRDELKVVTFTSSICFDASVAQLFSPLIIGSKIIVINQIDQLFIQLNKEQITCLTTAPSLLEQLLKNFPLPPCVKIIGLGGESVTETLLKQLKEYPNVEKILNFYGPTEATIGICSGAIYQR